MSMPEQFPGGPGESGEDTRVRCTCDDEQCRRAAVREAWTLLVTATVLAGLSLAVTWVVTGGFAWWTAFVAGFIASGLRTRKEA
ncbi:hypothetical protein [Amycolatopsis suaedae]|uniref:hypothetical protein n=1 Tax=Amycolatopsis suaedae TaxID=2510978 RepID=UPI0013EF265F|nr:hypothetical protein [Amycolatopsis suaedae]